MQGTSIMVRVLTVIMMCLVLASATPAAERMTVITYYNMTKGSEEQIKLVDGKWKAFLLNGPVDMAVADIENGYLEFMDEGTGGGKEQTSVALFLTRDKVPMLAVLQISGPSGQCPDTSYTLKTYTLRSGTLTEAKGIVPGVPFEPFFKKEYDLKKGAPHVVADRDYRVGYRLPQRGTTVEAFLDVSTAACALGVFGEQMSAEQRKVHQEFLQNVSKEPVKLKWNNVSGTFKLPDGVVAVAAPSAPALPRFVDHPVKEQFSGKPAAPDFKDNPDAKQYASKLKEGVAKGPNFAGTYTVVMWGCGSGCQSSVIVDAKTGKIYSPGLGTERGLCFRMDSSLIIADPITEKYMEDVPTRSKTVYYQWDGNKLKLITETSALMKDENCK